jgi:hypothetical protein
MSRSKVKYQEILPLVPLNWHERKFLFFHYPNENLYQKFYIRFTKLFIFYAFSTIFFYYQENKTTRTTKNAKEIKKAAQAWPWNHMPYYYLFNIYFITEKIHTYIKDNTSCITKDKVPIMPHMQYNNIHHDNIL